ncbi:MAG: RRXRR domain-containing protein, partial [Anaerolineae bacterium]|nr:RRXRR domain-containing protein [Anaerolineae bacterium]
MQNYVLVLDTHKQPLEPCHPARARQLLQQGKAAVLRREPFTIILKYVVEQPGMQASELKIDPGATTTGLALVRHGQNGARVIWAAELEHRGLQVKEKLDTRRTQRRARRSRKTRYRTPRFDN